MEPERRLLRHAMTHAGQLTMLRRLAGIPVPPEDFFLATVSAKNVGPEQSLPVSPDHEWPEAPAGWRAPTSEGKSPRFRGTT
jgi:hypothetical protein